jgi:putative tryptophan/tyrosine transport system substrate-binding protein
MRRREFIALVGSVAGWPLAAWAQQPSKIAKIGFLGLNPASSFTTRIEALWKGLHQLGYVEGKNLLIEYQWAETVEQLPELAAQLVRMKVDLIFAPVSTFVEPARQATKTIPIVFASHADPVGVGHVQSLAHPGGNVTGLSMLHTELAAKALEILHEAIPQSSRIGILWNPTTPSHAPALQSVQDAAASLGIRLYPAPTRRVEDFESAFASILSANADSLLVLASPMSYSDRGMLLAQLALKYRLPAMFGFKENAEAGGLMSYSADILDLYRRSAVYIDKIIKGASPADLPVEQASKYELVINLKTAKALGLNIPAAMIGRADEVIEYVSVCCNA